MSEDIKQFGGQHLSSVHSAPIHLSPSNAHTTSDTVGSSPVGSFSSLSLLEQQTQQPSPGTSQHMFTWSNVTSSSSPNSSNEWVQMINCGEFIGPK